MKKVIIISVSVLLVLLILVCSLVGYLDMLPGKPIPWDTVTMDSTGTVYYAGNLIRTNGLGTVVVAKNNLEPGDQRIAAWKGVFLDRISTHLTMLSLRKGMSLPQVIAAAGMPDGTSGLGIVCLDYNTPDGYTYAIYFSQRTAGGDQTDMVLDEILIYSLANGWHDSADVSAFLWKMRFIYIGVAVVLGAVLVALLTVPNIIRKKKAKSA